MKNIKIILVLAIMFVSLLSLTSLVNAQFAMPSSRSSLNLDTPYTREVLLNQDPDPAEPGKYVELRWKITKYGNEKLEDVTYEILPQFPFSLAPGTNPVQNLGSWSRFSGEDEHYILFYRLKVDSSALEHDYTIRLRSKNSVNENWVTKEYTIRVGESFRPSFVLGNIVSNPRRLVGDVDDAELSIDLENIGNGDAEQVTIYLELPEGFDASYTFSTRQNLGTILAGQGKNAMFYFDIDKNVMGGEYEAYAVVNYKEKNSNDNEYRQSRIPFKINVLDKPLFNLNDLVFLPSEIEPGDSNVVMRLNLENIGGKDAESVSVRVFKESSQPFTFDDNSDFIGKISSLNNGEAVFRFDVKNEAIPKDYNLDLEIRYLSNNQVFVESKSVVIPITGTIEESSRNFGIIIIVIIASLIAGFIGYKFGNKE